MIVLDASVAVKWYLAEAQSELAIELLIAESPDIAAPDAFAIEVASALVREANMDKAKTGDARGSLDRFRAICEGEGIRLVRVSLDTLAKSADLAINIGHPLKDCIYLALAMEMGCELVTADARFAAKARGVWDKVRVLGDGE